MKAFPLHEAAAVCGVAPDLILHFITLEWVVPVNQQEVLLDEEDLARIRLILELKEEFGVNEAAVPILLHLIDQIHCLHRNMNRLQR